MITRFSRDNLGGSLHGVPDDSGDDNGEDDEDNNNGDENPEEEEDDDPRYRGAEYHKHSTEYENGQFCVLLQEVLQHLGYTMKLLYVTKHFSEPGMRDYYTSRVYIRVPLIDTVPMGAGTTHHITTKLTSPLMLLRSMMQLEGLSGHSAMPNVNVYMGMSSVMFLAV
jgi:hypothetical protein